MDERDVRRVLDAAGESPTDGFRDELRGTVVSALRGEVPVRAGTPTSARGTGRGAPRGWWIAAAAAGVLAVAGVATLVLRDDPAPSVVPATVPPTPPTTDEVPASSAPPATASPVSTVATGSDPDLLAALSGHRWVVVASDDGSDTSAAGEVAWIEFADDPLIHGSDGCNLFGADGTLAADGAIEIPEVDSTAVGCDGPTTNLASARQVTLRSPDQIELASFDGATTWTLKALDAMPVPISDDVAGSWVVDPASSDRMELRADGVVNIGTCTSSWFVTDGFLNTGYSAATPCSTASTAAALFDALASSAGVSTVATDADGRPATILLSNRDHVLRLVRATPITSDLPIVSSGIPTPLVAAESVTLPIAPVDTTGDDPRWPVVRVDLDGSFQVLDTAASTLTTYEVTGAVRWTTSVPADIDGARPWTFAIGPDRIAYLSYHRVVDQRDQFVLAAVPTEGPRAGVAVGSWPTDWQCVESFCGDVLFTGPGIELGTTADGGVRLQPYVDDQGQPSGVQVALPERPVGADDSMPADVRAGLPSLPPGTDPSFLWTPRTTVTYGGASWQFDVWYTPLAEGTYTWFEPAADGGVVATFAVADLERGGAFVSMWLDLQPDGHVQAWRLGDDLGILQRATRVGGERYALFSATDGSSWRIVHLVTG
ncbi:MAG: META domain-containing protein [Acidimicrobiales bacterium]